MLTILATLYINGLVALLKAEYGIAFNKIGVLHPTCERHIIAIDFVLPRLVNDTRWYINNECNNEGFQAVICNHYINLIFARRDKSIALHAEINNRIQQILDILPNPNIEGERHRRNIFGIVSGIVGFVNTFLLRRQVNALETTLDILKQDNFDLQQDFLTLQDDISILTQVVSKEFNTLRASIQETNSRLDKLSDQFVKAWSGLREQTMNLVNYEAYRATNSMTLIADSILYYDSMFRYLSSFESGLVDLLEGKIPQQLLPPKQLQDILNYAAQVLHTQLPDYTLLHTELSNYYRKSSLIYKVLDGHLIVILPILLRKKNQHPMELYRIQTSLVPFEIGDASVHDTSRNSYTRIMIDNPYIAILDKNFLELSDTQLSQCEVSNKIWTCEQILLQTHKSRISCATAVFYNLGSDLIHEHCRFEYYHNITPPNQVIHSDDWVLLSGLSTPWTFNCHSKSTPIRHQGSNYAVTEISSLCDCDVIGPDFFIPSKTCPERINEMVLRYPINAAVYTVLPPDDPLLHNLNTSWLYDSPIYLDQDKLVFEPNNDPDVLHSSGHSEGIDLDKVAELIKSHSPIHYNRHDKSAHTNKFGNWWRAMDNIALAITFILSIIGACAGILALINCIRTHKISSYLGALMTFIKPTEASQLFCRRDADIADILPPLLLQLFLFITVLAIVRLLYHIYLNWSIVKILIPHHSNMKSNVRSNLILELGDLHGMRDIYICTLPCKPSDVCIKGYLHSVSYTAVWRRLYGYVSLPWSTCDVTVAVHGMGIRLPTIAYTPFHNIRAILNLLSADNYTIRLILINNGYRHVLNDPTIRQDMV